MILGKAYVEHEKCVVAGEYCAVKYHFDAGHPIDEGGFIKIVFRYAGDFGIPQFERPEKENYCSVSTTGDCKIIPMWNDKGHTRPWRKTLFLEVSKGYLDSGDKIVVVFGDVSGNSPGWRMQTFVEGSFEFKTFVDPIGTYQFKELPDSPALSVTPGKPVRGVCLAPSNVLVGEAFNYYLKLEDAWGNPVGKPQKIIHPGFSVSGHYTIEASDAPIGLSARSNPVLAENKMDLKNYWADFHGQSEETIGTNSIEDYFRFGRDYAMLDIIGHQGNDFQITDDFWDKIKRVSADFDEPGKFAALPGYEWSGNTPLGGDRNVYFSSDGDISRSCRDLLPGEQSKYPDSATANALFENLRNQSRVKSFVFAHVGGRYANMQMHDDNLEVAIEIHSAWGTFEWLLEDALKQGCRVGICANSDDHKGRPGASYPGAGLFGSYGGLTCVLASSLTRESVFEAMKARHFYATTGNRCLIIMRLEINGSPAGIMGDVIHCKERDDLLLKATIIGTAPVESLEMKDGLRTLKTFKTYYPENLGRKIKVIWSGSETRGRARMADWTGGLAVNGNRITSITPVNFWKPDSPLSQCGENLIKWQSVTTGGLAGCIIELEEKHKGCLQIETVQGKVLYDLSGEGYHPQIYNFGGLDKKISIYKLPDNLTACHLEFDIPVKNIHPGNNPLYLRMSQLDGNIAWTSPVYIRV